MRALGKSPQGILILQIIGGLKYFRLSVVVYQVRSVSGIRADRVLSIYSKASLVLFPFFSVAIAANASAQVISADNGTDTVVETDGDQFNITGGEYSDDDANLFHNFEQFGLSSGQTANFETIPNAQNVIGKVGGGQASTIDGTLKVSGSDASLYLVNPAGILMGPDAQLNLSGGFTATTATGIGFENGQFDANTNNYGQLTGEPSSFEFANEQAGAVVNAGDLSVDAENTIGLIGGTVVNTGSLSAPGGDVAIAAVEGESRVRISQRNQILSLEVEADDPSRTISTITAKSIGSMLTGSGLDEATALRVNPDGTVQLSGNVINESGGSAIAAGTLSAIDIDGNDDAVNGNSVTINAADIIAGDINTSTVASTRTDDTISAGSIALKSSGSVVAGDLVAVGRHRDGGGRSPHGGDITVTANSGDISTGIVSSTSDGDRRDAGNGGAIRLEASRSVTTQSIDASSKIPDSSNGTRVAGAGGAVTITAGSGDITIEGDLDSQSKSLYDSAGTGGNIELAAPLGKVYVSGDIVSSADGQQGAGDAGSIELTASRIEVGRLESISESTLGSSGKANAISLRGDIIDFGEGADSVKADSIGIRTLTQSQNINLGDRDDNDPLALNVTDLELSIIGNNVGKISIAQIDGTGTVQIASSVTSANASSRAPLEIKNIQTLIGPNENVTYKITSFNSGFNNGRIVGSGSAVNNFFAVRSIQAGKGDDIFQITPGIPTKNFDALNGGEGTNTLDYRRFTVGLDVSLLGLSNVSILTQSSPAQVNTLTGADADSVWNITGENTGAVSNGITFDGFSILKGGNRTDEFVVGNGGRLTGGLLGGEGESRDVLSYADFNGDVGIDLQAQTGPRILRFSGVESFVGNGKVNSFISGSSGRDVFKITGDRTGNVNGDFFFSDFGIVNGVDGTDRLVLAAPTVGEQNLWTVNKASGGYLDFSTDSSPNNRIEFKSFELLEGNGNNDFFRLSDNGSIETIRGSSNNNTISYEDSDGSVFVDLQRGIATGITSEFSDIQRFIGSRRLNGILSGFNDGDRLWTIADKNSGAASGVTFANFDRLLGNGGNDTFTFGSDGNITGEIRGGAGDNTLNYKNYDGTVRLSLAESSVENNLRAFSEIRRVVGNGTSEIVGRDRNTAWKIQGANSGEVNGLIFSEFNSLIGGRGSDEFRFTEGGRLSGQAVGGDGIDDLNYEEHESSSIEIYPDSVLDEGGIAITANFSEIERVFGGSQENTLYNSEENNRFEAQQQNGRFELGNSTFFNIDRVSGTSKNVVLDYSQLRTATIVDLENFQVLGGAAFENIGQIIGSSRSSKNSVLGKDGGDRFIIAGDRTIETDGLLLSGFSNVNGGAGNNQFIVNKTSASNVVIEGGSDNRDSQNLITSAVTNANWQLGVGRNAGRLEGATGTVLAEFSQIQNLENATSGGMHRVNFTRPSSQITGSINGGGSDLTLVGDDINIGNNEENNFVGGEISGSGRLTILPRTAGVDIELGGRDRNGRSLNITDGELAAIQSGFSQVAIGDKTLTGSLLFKGDAVFENDVTLQSRGAIDTDGYLLSASGQILMEGDRIAAGVINSRDSVSLVAAQDILAKSILAAGQGIRVESAAGEIVVDREIAASGQQSGSAIRLSAQKDVVAGDIRTNGGQGSGSVNIFSAAGGITTGGISTSNLTGNITMPSALSGGVVLKAQDEIAVEFVDARGVGDRSSQSGFISIETEENFIATGTLSGTRTSLSTAGVRDGEISIRYGNPNRLEQPFLVGQASNNGTVGSIRAALEIVSGDVPSGLLQGNITITDLGYRLAAPRTLVAPLKVAEPLTTDRVSAPEIVINDSGSSQETLSNLESGVGEEFKQYLDLPEDGKQRKVATIGGIQQTLQTVENTTGTTPALVYVYFVPDAASESSVASQETQTPAPNDQLELMVVNLTGEPVRKRQWGITRAQVEAASGTLREQITSQFTSASQYLEPAQQLYNWIVRPISSALEEQQVESIGFVMDTGLRTMPLAALHDGEHYLVENYSLGLMPTFSLTDFKAQEDVVDVDFKTARVLAMGASRFANQPDLPAVSAEVSLITQGKWEGDAFLNEDFVLENLQTQIKGQDYGVVHLATHASFESGDMEKSYIQLWDEKLALDDIGDLGLNEANIGLIILSACNTALGDRASEYGFAGFAVTAGSQSALASLWPVNDEGTLGFMSQFYDELRQAPVRSEALRQAQIRLIQGEVGIDSGVVYDAIGDEIAVLPSLAESGRWDFSHPFFWSAFTMIGNPW